MGALFLLVVRTMARGRSANVTFSPYHLPCDYCFGFCGFIIHGRILLLSFPSVLKIYPVTGHQKAQAQAKNQKAKAAAQGGSKGGGAAGKADRAAKMTLKCSVCLSPFHAEKTLLEHFQARHPKATFDRKACGLE